MAPGMELSYLNAYSNIVTKNSGICVLQGKLFIQIRGFRPVGEEHRRSPAFPGRINGTMKYWIKS